MTLATIIALALTVCFFGLLALILTAPEGHETPGIGFHYGDLAHCPECDVWLRSHEGCLHIAPSNDSSGQSPECDRAALPVSPCLHAEPVATTSKEHPHAR